MTLSKSWDDWLLRVSVFYRNRFFRYWNQASSHWDLETRLLRISEYFASLPTYSLPKGIHFVSMIDKDYPPKLFHLPQPPLGLFCRGTLSKIPSVSVVGSRRPLPYSIRRTRQWTQKWAQEGLNIVSGGALGIDGVAHESCLEVKGYTTVVLGGGFNKLHPQRHQTLFERVVSCGGVLLSEYPPDFTPRPYTFPERNRIIAALGDTLFLAQAHEKSGSLSTARTALELGREIYVLRPVLENENFKGSEKLIEDGATCLL